MTKLLLLACVVIASCGGPDLPPPLPPAERDAMSAASVTALQAGKFDDALAQATTVLASDPRNARAAAVRAIARYQQAGHGIVHELGQIIERADKLEFFDHKGGRAAWQKFLDALDAVDRDLAVVAADPAFSLELCLACWERDWNHSGEIDDGDRRLFEVEVDLAGEELPEGDPRRRPTFRFDTGDALWGRAMISFQRALGELVLAYKWSELDRVFGDDTPDTITIRLADRGRVTRARSLILSGLDHAERCRAAYLGETDDDREWVPNPRQKSYAVPLEVDDTLYATWSAVLGDFQRLLRSQDGISIREIAMGADDDLVTRAPDAYIDLGRLLGDPKDLRIEASQFNGPLGPPQVEKILRGLLGNGYQTKMKASPLVGRLRAMKEQMDRDEDTFERKMRYLFWLN